MAKKKPQEEKITLGLAGPAIWGPAGGKISGLEGKDFDEGEGDISPVTISDAADFAEKMMQDGRRDAGTGNEFYPDETNATASSSKKGDSLPVPKSGAKGNIYKEAADLAFTGGEYQEANTAVGVTPNFFTSDDAAQEVGAFIDKTGADPAKGGSDLPDKKAALEVATSAQLTSRNDYSPDGSGPASPSQYEELNPKSPNAPEALVDELYKGEAGPLGVGKPQGQPRTLGKLLANVGTGIKFNPDNKAVKENQYAPLVGFGNPVSSHSATPFLLQTTQTSSPTPRTCLSARTTHSTSRQTRHRALGPISLSRATIIRKSVI